jgi:hypothetical protein
MRCATIKADVLHVLQTLPERVVLLLPGHQMHRRGQAVGEVILLAARAAIRVRRALGALEVSRLLGGVGLPHPVIRPVFVEHLHVDHRSSANLNK